MLIVEDDEATAELERRVLARAGLEVRLAARVADTLALLATDSFVAILLDYQLPDGDAWQVVEAANAKTPRIPVILVTAMGNERVAAEAIQRGVADYVKKSDGFWDQLPRTVDRVTRLSLAEERLRREQARLAEAQRIAHLGSWEWDIPSDTLGWSDELYRIFGREEATFGATYRAFLDCIHPGDRAAADESVRSARVAHQPFRSNFRILRDGQERFIEARGSTVLGPTGDVVRMVGTAQDVTEREVQQALLRESEAFFQMSLDLLSTAGGDGYFRRVNPAFSCLGYTEHELLTTPFMDFVHPEDVPATLAELDGLSRGVRTLHFENRYRCKDGSYRWISWVASPSAAGIIYATGRDVTEQKRAAAERDALNASLKRSLAERDVLLQEVHHRVKNNLQVISSLIHLQIHKLEAGENRDALQECRSRVEAIALIHEKLYQSNDYAQVSFAEYARSLTASIFHASSRSSGDVQLELMVDDVPLTVEQAIPCGLVLNELITNALKHGFRDGRSGTVRVEFGRCGDGSVRLAVSNDGIALPDSFDVERAPSLGMQLVATLSCQLDSQLEVRRRPQTVFQLTFALEKPSHAFT